MTKEIEFYFDFGSPYSYLAQSQLKKLATDTGYSIAFKPIHVLDLMKAVNNRPTSIECREKRKYAKQDIERWAKKYGVSWQPGPHVRTMDLNFLLYAAIAALKLGVIADFVPHVFSGLYSEGVNVSDPEILKDFLKKKGLPGDEIVEMTKSQEVADELIARNKAAQEAGLFGAPTFRVGGEIYFGNDRLAFVESAAKAEA